MEVQGETRFELLCSTSRVLYKLMNLERLQDNSICVSVDNRDIQSHTLILIVHKTLNITKNILGH